MKLSFDAPIDLVVQKIVQIGSDSEVLAKHLEDLGIVTDNGEASAAFDAAGDALYQAYDLVSDALEELAKVYPAAVQGAQSIVHGPQAAEAPAQGQPS